MLDMHSGYFAMKIADEDVLNSPGTTAPLSKVTQRWPNPFRSSLEASEWRRALSAVTEVGSYLGSSERQR